MRFLTNEILQRGRLNYVDVGAMGGIPAKWARIKPCLKVIGFEPDKREFAKLQNSDYQQFFNRVVYGRSENITLNITRDPGKTSIYKPNFAVLNAFPDSQRHQVVETLAIDRAQVDSLDHILGQHTLDADFLKIDTQGSELDILKGAAVSLGHAFGVEVEVEFLSLYESQPLFGDVHALLTRSGFVLYDLRRAYWKHKPYCDYIGKGQLVFADALYVKERGEWLRSLACIADEQKRTLKILNAVMACLVYGLYDYAVTLIQGAAQQGMISADYGQRLTDEIIRESRAKMLPYFWGREFLHKVFKKLAEYLRPRSHLGWADGDQFIGNVKSH